jgi:hypothetical protein
MNTQNGRDHSTDTIDLPHACVLRSEKESISQSCKIIGRPLHSSVIECARLVQHQAAGYARAERYPCHAVTMPAGWQPTSLR